MHVLLDKRGITPPASVKAAWNKFRRKLEDSEMRLQGFERMDRAELAFSRGNVEVRHVEAWEHQPTWTTPIIFSLNGPVTQDDAGEISRLLVDSLLRVLPVPEDADNIALYSQVVLSECSAC